LFKKITCEDKKKTAGYSEGKAGFLLFLLENKDEYFLS